MIDADKKVTESKAIIFHLCRKENRMDLLGITEEEKLQVKMIQSIMDDLYQRCYMILYSENP